MKRNFHNKSSEENGTEKIRIVMRTKLYGGNKLASKDERDQRSIHRDPALQQLTQELVEIYKCAYSISMKLTK